MKQTLLLVIIGFLTFPFGSMSQSTDKGKTYDLTGFSALSLNIPADVILTKGDHHITIHASEKDLEKIKVEKNNQTVIIKTDNGNDLKGEKIKIEISMPTLNGLEVNGSGRIQTASPFQTGSLELEVNGSGEISMSEVNSEKLEAQVNGSGNISNLKGSASESHFEINGSGDIEAGNFISKKAEAEVTGSGNIRLHATEILNAEITGSGEIFYRGSPANKNVDITGSGSVKAL